MRGACRSLLFVVGLLILAPLNAGAQAVRICAIQGSGPIPNMLGSRVTSGGVVTADFQASLGGFFMQEPGCDGDATTSDGIFVRTGTRAVPVTVGNRVTVTGKVSNDFGLTAIELESVAEGGSYAGTLEAVRLSPPADPAAAAVYLEAFEAMLVSLPPSRVVAATNPENLFDPVDDPGKDDDAPTAEQYAVNLSRRANSIARYLGLPDVLGVQEVEKIEVLQDLAAQPALLPAAYRAVLVEGIDARGIDVGLLYNSQRLWLRSAESRQGCSDVRPPDGAIVPCARPGGGAGYMLFSRPPLVARLEALDNHERLTVIVNHFKSQSSDTTADDRLRLTQADFVRAAVDELKGAEADVPVIVLGDFNDFEDSLPLQHLAAGGRLVNLLVRPAGERPYTYVFQGLCQTLDHILIDPALVPRVVELRPLHVNVDFGDPGPGAPAEASPRASDHDPVRLLLSRP